MLQVIMGPIIAAVGIAGIFWINSRVFNRRNQAGIEVFNGYASSVFIRFFEKIAKIACWFFVLGGIFALLFGLRTR